MAESFEVDISSMVEGLKKASEKTLAGVRKGLIESAEELLRLSTKEVPHDEGSLQDSGTIDVSGLVGLDPSISIGYNKVYAARLHEHPQYRFQKGRKGKYLEDPLKNNKDKFAEHVANKIKSEL